MKAARHLLAAMIPVIVTALHLATPCFAQFNASVYAVSTYDDNSWAFYQKRADVYHQIFLSLSRDFSAKHSFHQAFYYGAAVLFRTWDTRTYNQHTAGLYSQWQLDYRADESEDDTESQNGSNEENDPEEEQPARHASFHEARSVRGPAQRSRSLYRGAFASEEVFNDSLVTYLITKPYVSGRFDKAEFAFYDFRRAAANMLLRKHLVGPLMGRLQYEFAYKQYPSFVQFTHFEHDASATLNSRVVNTIELFGGLGFGHKKYAETVFDTVFIETGNSGKGKGGVKPKKKIVSEYSTPSAEQFVLNLGAVHTLGARATLSASWLRRINTSNQARYVDRRGVEGATEDEIFEDRYGYEADEVQAVLRLAPASRFSLEVEGAFAGRRYPRTAADLFGEDLPGAPMREDSRYSFIVRALCALLSRSDGGALLSVGAGYRYLRNASNDAYHDYHINQVWAAAQINM